MTGRRKMRNHLPVVFAAVVAACFLVPEAQAAEKMTVGNAASVVRTVTGTFEADTREIALLDDLYHNELVETGEESATEIVFLDETRLALGPDSSMMLDKFVFDPDPDKASFVITATKGVFRFASGKLPGKSYEIRTPTATIGIRGTAFTLSVLPAEDGGSGFVVELVMESGAALVTSCHSETVLVEAPAGSSIGLDLANSLCPVTVR